MDNQAKENWKRWDKVIANERSKVPEERARKCNKKRKQALPLAENRISGLYVKILSAQDFLIWK